MRFVESDESLSLRGAQLLEAIEIDKKQNLIPFFVSICIVTKYAKVKRVKICYLI